MHCFHRALPLSWATLEETKTTASVRPMHRNASPHCLPPVPDSPVMAMHADAQAANNTQNTFNHSAMHNAGCGSPNHASHQQPESLPEQRQTQMEDWQKAMHQKFRTQMMREVQIPQNIPPLSPMHDTTMHDPSNYNHSPKKGIGMNGLIPFVNTGVGLVSTPGGNAQWNSVPAQIRGAEVREINTCMYVCICIYVYVYTHKYIYIYKCKYLYIYTYIYTYLYIYKYLNILCIYVCIYIYIYIYLYIYIHT